ncbi:MAG: LCP family protein [Candidatus Faecousia sp.]|nr:LCP family protein [Candidatus Faecousia sp.]
MARKKSKDSSGTRTVLSVLCVMLGLILAVMLSGTVYAEYLLGKMNYVAPDETQPRLSQEEYDAMKETEEHDPDFTGPQMNEDDVTLEDPNAQIGGEGQNIVNILLIGQDTTNGTRARSDSMILVTVNKDKNTITMTSFLRDLYVKIPGYKKNRINASYALGGMTLLDETLETNFGVHVDGNVEVDFNHFTEIIDLLHGVTIDLTAAEASYINKWVPEEKAVEGVNRLSGAQALMYARNRHDARGDFNRTNRQRTLLNALIEEYKDTSLTTMLGMLDDILPMITTDLTRKEIVGYAQEFLPMLASAEIVTQRIPADDCYKMAMIDGMSVLVPDINKNVQILVDSLTESDGVG